ncbi:MAG: SAM-dependent chlorinase/fluorinase [Patescibacteria group bacterium]|nr:SAM-dependent chlorinase/fluorinase [Patescibacteria group bacterium]
MKKVLVVADWAADPLYTQQFRSALGGYMSAANFPDLAFIPAHPSTIHTGYLAAQAVETEERLGSPLETVLFVHTDPRLPVSERDDVPRPAELLILLLVSGLYVVGTNAGNAFSLLKHKVHRAFTYPGINEQPASRGRDVYSRIVAHLAENLETKMELEEIHTHLIPLLDRAVVGHVDVFGNIHTSIHREDLREKHAYNEIVTVRLHGAVRKARFVEHLFAGTSGELVVYPGPCGPQENPYLSISAWEREPEELGKTGAECFGYPKPGETVSIE